MYKCLDTSEMCNSPWLKEIRSMWNNFGFSLVWLSQEVPSPVGSEKNKNLKTCGYVFGTAMLG